MRIKLSLAFFFSTFALKTDAVSTKKSCLGKTMFCPNGLKMRTLGGLPVCKKRRTKLFVPALLICDLYTGTKLTFSTLRYPLISQFQGSSA
jgi:hypothetical protein